MSVTAAILRLFSSWFLATVPLTFEVTRRCNRAGVKPWPEPALMLFAGGSTKIRGRVAPVKGNAELKAGWFAYIEGLKFEVTENKGILWAKIDPAKALEIAKRKGPGFQVIGPLLEKNGFWAQYKAEFGESKTELTYRIWERVSMKYVSSLKGQVTVYVKKADLQSSIVAAREGMLAPGKGGGAWNPPVPVLVTEIEEAIDSNPAITSIKMIDDPTGEVINAYFRGMSGQVSLPRTKSK